MHKHIDLKKLTDAQATLRPVYGGGAASRSVPRYEMPETEMSPDQAYNLIHDELALDGNARLNLATFVTTWMEPEARRLMAECFDKNMVDRSEYPQTAEIESRCVNMLARLWNAPEGGTATGISTVGSSEAAMLGGLAMKWRWRARQRAAGKPTDQPNLVMGANTQICWHKFCRYWDVEPREVTAEGDRFTLSPEEALKLVDENTIGVVAIMGSTYDGTYEPVEELCQTLDGYQERSGLDVPVHVDGASGAMIAPFLQPDLRWDFRLPRVRSINCSGHKFGLVFPGVGWILWRGEEDLPKELVFHEAYLGGDQIDLSINFSRPGSQVVAQYYNFLRLGKAGYRDIQQNCQDVAVYLSGQIGELGPFELITRGTDIPVFCWTLRDPDKRNFTLYDIADRLSRRGWQVPAYPMPANRQDLIVQRVVVKHGFTHDLADMLLEDIRHALDYFAGQPGHTKTEKAPKGFAH